MLTERITRFLTNPAAEGFEPLAREAFRFQYERVAPLRTLCERRGLSPDSLADWRDVPLVPTTAFRTLRLEAAPAVEVFRSSGTRDGEALRSVHHHGFPDLYRATLDASFPQACLPPGGAPPTLSLIPSRQDLPDSSLSFMAEHVLTRYAAPGSATVFGARGLDGAAMRSWLSAHQRGRRPVLVLATAFALAQALDRIERQELRFRMPAGSVLFETGGFKGRSQELSREELLARVRNWLGIETGSVVREYGMTELTSQCYTAALDGEDPDLFVPPHWVRVRILDPETLAECPPGVPGLIALFDLANLSSAVHVLTEDLGLAEGQGFRLVGRAAGAQLRGCSLAAEELGGG
jgi:Acyl-protein synthetase, LuxE